MRGNATLDENKKRHTLPPIKTGIANFNRSRFRHCTTSLVEHGENQRFLIPLQTAVVFWVLWMAFAILEYRLANQKNFAKIEE